MHRQRALRIIAFRQDRILETKKIRSRNIYAILIRRLDTLRPALHQFLILTLDLDDVVFRLLEHILSRHRQLKPNIGTRHVILDIQNLILRTKLLDFIANLGQLMGVVNLGRRKKRHPKFKRVASRKPPGIEKIVPDVALGTRHIRRLRHRTKLRLQTQLGRPVILGLRQLRLRPFHRIRLRLNLRTVRTRQLTRPLIRQHFAAPRGTRQKHTHHGAKKSPLYRSFSFQIKASS